MKAFLYELCRWAAVAAAIFFITESVGSGSTVSSADPHNVLKAAYSSADTSNMQHASNQMIKRIYGIDPSEYEFCTLYYPLTNMDVDELFLIKYADKSQEQKVISAFESRLNSQKNVFESYGVGQMELLSNHSLYISDSGFAFFIINSRADEARYAFTEAIRGK